MGAKKLEAYGRQILRVLEQTCANGHVIGADLYGEGFDLAGDHRCFDCGFIRECGAAEGLAMRQPAERDERADGERPMHSAALRQEDETLFYDLADQRRYAPTFADRRVYVHSTASREMVRYVIRDEGPGFDVQKIADPTDEEHISRVGGRGMLLIRSFMDEVQHNSKGNEITLAKYLHSRSGNRPEAGIVRSGLQLV